MGVKKKEVIGNKFTSTTNDNFTIIKELEQGKGGQRYFVIQCDKCNTEKNASYSNIHQTKKIRCVGCMPKVEKSEEDVTLKRKAPVMKDYIGKTIKMKFDEFYVIEELPRVLSKNGKNIYRQFLVKCTNCGTERETLAASINSGGVACNNCRTKDRNVRLDLSQPPINLERKIEVIHEINQIWDEMKRMGKNNELTNYLVNKFGAPDWLLEDGGNEVSNEVSNQDNIDDIDYDNPDINWDDELDKYI